jgi:hypothetical protein
MTGRRFRFGLRALLLVLTAAAIALTYYKTYVSAWWTELDHIVELRQKGGQVFTEPRGQYLFRQFAGDALSERAVYVHLSGAQIDDEVLAHVAELPYVEVLSIASRQVTDLGLAHLESLHSLRDLNLVDTRVTDEGEALLRRALPHCSSS